MTYLSSNHLITNSDRTEDRLRTDRTDGGQTEDRLRTDRTDGGQTHRTEDRSLAQWCLLLVERRLCSSVLLLYH